MSTVHVYSFVGSQWAGVAHLALAEKGFVEGKDYEIKEIDLAKAENFDPEYLKINPNGTVPSLTAPDLPKPLTDSVDILRYLDAQRPDAARVLVPQDAATKAKSQAIIDFVHSPLVDTNIPLFQTRDAAELDARKRTWHKDFIDARQHRLVKEQAADAAHPFYGPKAQENGVVFAQYNTPAGGGDKDFFAHCDGAYKGFAQGMGQFEELLVLPYAAGETLTEADFHAIPWLSHTMASADSDVNAVQDFSTLEKVLGKSAPGFKVGPRTRQWWKNVAEEPAFKKVFPVLH